MSIYTFRKGYRDSMSACSVISFMSDSLRTHVVAAPRLLCPWDFPGKNTRVSCHALLQGIFLNQESNLCLPHLLH